MAEVLTCAVERGIATVALARPAVRNAFNAELIAALRATFDELSERADVRAVVLAGEGPVFCGGADVGWMRAALDLSYDENVADAEAMSDMFRSIDRCARPVVARVQGAALGCGAGLVAVCDVAIASADATFGFTEVKLGIIPAVISPFVLAKIGASHARALFVTGRRFDAAHAREIGLVHAVVPEPSLDAAVDGVLDELRTAAPTAVGAIKALVADVLGASYDASRGLTSSAIAKQRTSEEGQEGLRAFLERRPAAFVE
ncbi:MAG: enoyl-CoA hydratase-related protein [Candidatus Tyrphobacter sp.]